MAQFIPPQQLYHTIRCFFSEPCHHIFLMLPRLIFDDSLLYLLRRLSVPVVFLCGSYSQNSLNKITSQIEHVAIFVTNHVPAQIILTDGAALYTNINFERYSRYDDCGVGFRVSKKQNFVEYSKFLGEIEQAIRRGTCVVDQLKPRNGYCIRCKNKISWMDVKGVRGYKFSPSWVLCEFCLTVWSFYENYNYKERYCYVCGNYHESSVAYPLCRSCFREHNYSN